MLNYQVNLKKQESQKKCLGSNEIDSLLIFLYLVKEDMNGVVRKILFILQIESDRNTYNEAMFSKYYIFFFGKM